MIPASPKNRNSRPVEIAAPQLPSEPEVPSDPMLLLGSEEVDGALFRTADFSGLCREHLSIRSSCFAGSRMGGSATWISWSNRISPIAAVAITYPANRPTRVT